MSKTEYPAEPVIRIVFEGIEPGTDRAAAALAKQLLYWEGINNLEKESARSARRASIGCWVRHWAQSIQRIENMNLTRKGKEEWNQDRVMMREALRAYLVKRLVTYCARMRY